jgi:hypothetical protein
MRAAFPVLNVERPGRFAYPVDNSEAFQYLENEVLTVEAYTLRGLQGPTPDIHRQTLAENFVHYRSAGGASVERQTDLDPDAFGDVPLPPDTIWTPINVAVLNAALKIAKQFTESSSAAPDKEVIQLLAECRPGKLVAGDGRGFVVFECAAFLGKQLTIHRRHVATLLAFLSHCDGLGEVVETATNCDYHYARTNGLMFGWSADELALTTPNQGAWENAVVVSVAPDQALSLLAKRGNRRALGANVDRPATVEVLCERNEQAIRLFEEGGRNKSQLRADHLQTPVAFKGASIRVEINGFRRLFETVHALDQVQLHIGFSATEPEKAVLCTLEKFEVAGYPCRVTRGCRASVTALAHTADDERIAPLQTDKGVHAAISAH